MFSQTKVTVQAHKETSPQQLPISLILQDEQKFSAQPQFMNGQSKQYQTLRKIDIINREKNCKGSSTTKEGQSIQLRVTAEATKHLVGKTPTKSGRNQPGFNQLYLGQNGMLDKQINCSDINTMQSSVTEFDAENFNDYDMIKQSFTSSIETLESQDYMPKMINSQPIISSDNKHHQANTMLEVVNICNDEVQNRKSKQNSASQSHQQLKNQESYHTKEINKQPLRVPSTFSSNRRQVIYQETAFQKGVNDLPAQQRISNKDRVQTFSAEKTPNSRRQARQDNSSNDFSEHQNPLHKTNHPSLFSAQKKPLERLLSPSGHSKTSLQSQIDLQMPTIDLTEAHHQTSNSNPGSASYISNIQSKMTQLRVISLTTKSSAQTPKVDMRTIHRKVDVQNKKKPHQLQVVITKETNASKPQYHSMTPKVAVIEKQIAAGISFQEPPKYAVKTIQTQQSSSSSSQGIALSANEKQ